MSAISRSFMWMVMEGSSEFGCQRSDTSRGLDSPAVSDRNNRSLRANTIRFSGDASDDSGCIPGRKGRERPQSNYPKTEDGVSEDGVAADPVSCSIECNDISLRQWLDNPGRTVDALECLHIFAQIVEIVKLAHSQGIVVHNVRPSCFVMSSFNRVAFIESASCSDSGSDSFEDGSNSQTAEFKSPHLPSLSLDLHQREILLESESSQLEMNLVNASQIVSESSCLQWSSDHATPVSLEARNVAQAEENKHLFPLKHILNMEINSYMSPEEVSGAPSSCASDIYRLGVLLFELFCTFSSDGEKSATMSSLRHRVLPPPLLLKWPKEASFCLRLLHPEPTNRPTIGELLQSKFLNEPKNSLEERDLAIKLRERIEEQEELLEFLFLMQQRKEEAANYLHETVSFLSSDIEEVTKMQTALTNKEGSSLEPSKELASGTPLIDAAENENSGGLSSRKLFSPELQIHNMEEFVIHQKDYKKSKKLGENQGSILSKKNRLMKNFKKLESAYFLTRCRACGPTGKQLARHSSMNSDGRGSVSATERSSVNNLPSRERRARGEGRQSGWINTFLEGLYRYLSFRKIKVKADLKQRDLLNSSNLVCSLDFDRDGEFFATAGVNKKIKVFGYRTILNNDLDIHYPVVEMASKSKLSSICWNGCIKSQIASSNFDGVVQVWDATRSQIFMEMREHERCVWSVDFSLSDPTMLASGSDDGCVKLWNINQGVSVGTIKTKANVCCVQFPIDSGRYLAFGSADHRIYYYDLRNLRIPLCTLVGHNKTVSYVKFIDSTNLVSASTDNTLKLWDLSMCTSQVLDCPLQSFSGHMNVKNFVGLSVSEGYIATGSETNEVCIYYKAFPMPVLSFKFSTADPLSGGEVDDSAQFVSSVCWRGHSTTLVAANSMGNIKLLEMV